MPFLLNGDIFRPGTADRRSLCRVGFTLIELLVVLAIIVLLVGVILPSLAAAKASAGRVLCQSRLRQWGVGFEIYASENDNYYPHTDGLDRDKGPADRCGWVDVAAPLLGLRPWRDHPPWRKPGVETLFQCGSARLAPDRLYSYNARRNGFFSYAMNSCLELDENCWRAPGDAGGAMESFLKIDLIVQPSRVILLFDQLLDPARGYDGKRRYRDAGKYCGSYPKAFGARHGAPGGAAGGSVLFCDGHVEFTESLWKAHWPADLEVPPRDDRNWFPYPAK